MFMSIRLKRALRSLSGICCALATILSVSLQAQDGASKVNPPDVLELSIGRTRLLSFQTNGVVLEVESNGVYQVTPRIGWEQVATDDLRQLIALPPLFSYLTEFTNSFNAMTDDPRYAALYNEANSTLSEAGASRGAPFNRQAFSIVFDAEVLREKAKSIWQSGSNLQQRVSQRIGYMKDLSTYQATKNTNDLALVMKSALIARCEQAIERYNNAVPGYNRYLADRAERIRTVEGSAAAREFYDARQNMANMEAALERQKPKAEAAELALLVPLYSLFERGLLPRKYINWRNQPLTALGQLPTPSQTPPMVPEFRADREVLAELRNPPSAPSPSKGAANVVQKSERAESIKKLSDRAMEGDVTAQYQLGLAYLEGNGISKDLQRAMDCFRAAAAKGNQDAKAALARLLEEQPR